MKNDFPRLTACAAAVASALSTWPVTAATVNWTDATGFWDVVTNWSTLAEPQPGDDVIINVAGNPTVTFRTNTRDIGSLAVTNATFVMQSGALTITNAYTNNATTSMTGGTLVLNGTSSTSTFNQSGGQLSGSGTFTVTGPASVTFGGHSGSGTTRVQGATTISSSGLQLDGGRLFRNEGTLTQTGNVNLNNRAVGAAEAGSGSVLNVMGATWTASGSTSIFASNQGAGDTGADALFTNAGTFNRAGASTTTVSVLFNNTGTVNVQEGTLTLSDGGTHTGAFDVAAGATLNLSGGTHNFNAGSVTSPGTLQIGNATINFNVPYSVAGTTSIVSSGTLNLGANNASTGALTQSHGQVTGTGTFTVTGPANITFGGHSGSGTTRVQGATTISSSGLQLDGGRLFRNEGTLTQTGSVNLNSRAVGAAQAGSGSVLNAAGATWNVSTSTNIFASNQGGGDTGADALFTNAGTFNRAGASTTTVSVLFNNTGTVNVQEGTLTLSDGGTHTGAFDVAAGATLNLSGGTHNFNAGSVTSPGTLQIGNATINFNVPYSVAGTTSIVSSGTLNLGANNASTGALTQSHGQVTGTGTFTVTGPANITFGGHSGSGTTRVQGATTISSSGLQLDGGRLFRNEGTLTQTGNVNLNSRAVGAAQAGSGSVLNALGATWIASGSTSIFASNQGGGDTGADALFTNAGTFNRAGASTTTVSVLFNNTGTVNVQEGTLTHNDAFTHSGALTIAAGATMNLGGSGVTHTVNTASTTIAGTLQQSNGTINFTTAHTIGGTGNFLQSFGQITGANLTFGPSTTVTINSGGHSGDAITTVQATTTIASTGLLLDGLRVFRNQGTVTQTGNVNLNSRNVGAIQAGSGSVLNAVGATWTADGSSSILATNQGVGDTGADAVFNNAGTFNRTGTSGTTVSVLFNNTGTVNVQQGTLTHNDAFTHSGALTIAAGATMVLGGSGVTHTVNTASTTIAGTLQQSNGTINFTNAHTLGGTGTFFQGFGQVTGANLTLGPNTTATINSGGHSGDAITTVQGTTTIASTGLLLDGLRVFRNEGTVTQTGNVNLNSRNVGAIQAGSGSVLNAAGGIWTASGSVSIFASNQGVGDTGADAVFNNAGTFNRTGTSGTTVSVLFNNTGTVNVQQGTLTHTDSFTHSGALTIAAGATMNLGGSGVTHTVNTASTTIAGTLQHSNGTINFTTAHTIGGTGNFLQSFGQVTGANLTLGPNTTASINNGGHSGNATTTVQGTTTIASTGLLLDGARVFRNEGTVTQTGNVNLNSRNVGAIQAGSGSVLNAVGATWTADGSTNIFATNQGVSDTGADAVFNNAGTFNRTGTSVTSVSVLFNNTGTVNVQEGTLTHTDAFTHSGALTIAAGATMNLGGSGVTHTVNTASTTIAGTLQHSNGTINFTTAHTIGGTGTFLQSFGQVTGANLTLGPNTTATINNGGHSGNATTTVQGTTTIASTGLLLDGARVFRNEGTVTQTGNVNLNSRNVGAIQAGSGSVLNAAGATWTADGSSNIFATNQGVGDTGADALFTNAGTFNRTGTSSTTVSVLFNNTGTVNAQEGTLLFTRGIQGTGTLQTSGGTVNLQAASTTGNLFHNTNAANSLVLGTNNVTVSNDYNNANFGTGDAFNRYANVSRTTGAILGGGDVNQAITAGPATTVTNGTSTTPTLTIGNLRVGVSTFTYNIANTGSTGPAIRGAIQTGVGGANITDARLSGSGVTEGSFGPVGPGESTAREVVVTIASAGPIAPITGQAVGIVNNFQNLTQQLLTINAAPGAAVYQAAVGQLNTTALNFGTVQVGQAVSQTLSVTNIATGPSGFVEDLNARFGTATGTGAGLISGTGQIAALAAGGTNTSAMTVSVNTSAAATVNGAIPVNFFSAGSVGGVSNGLAEISVGSTNFGVLGTIQAVGQVINQASPLINTPTVALGNVRVGAASPVGTVSVTNQATTAPQAALNASISAASPLTATGSFNLLARERPTTPRSRWAWTPPAPAAATARRRSTSFRMRATSAAASPTASSRCLRRT
jgi:fibronectin-binding autotransporter adhesin